MTDNVVYDRMDVNADSAAWDDEELIRMYDRATAMTHEKIQKKEKSKSKTGTDDGKTKEKKPWKVGDTCMALYAEDGKCYPAKIMSIDATKKKCEVLYTEYNEAATVLLSDLFRSPSSSPSRETASPDQQSSSAEVVGESWRNTSTSWKSASSHCANESWMSASLTTAPWSQSSPDVGSVSEGRQETTWKRLPVTTMDCVESSANTNSVGTLDVDALRAAYPPEVVDELLRAHFNNNADVSVGRMTTTEDWRQPSAISDRISHACADSDEFEPSRKRSRTATPLSTIVMSQPLPTLSSSTGINSQVVGKQAYTSSTRRSLQTYASYDDYSIFAYTNRIPLTLKRKAVELKKDEHASVKRTHINSALTKKEHDDDAKYAMVRVVKFSAPYSPYPPKYAPKIVQGVAAVACAAAKKFYAENQLRPVSMKKVFDLQAEQLLQQMANSCINSVERVTRNKNSCLPQYDCVTYSEIRDEQRVCRSITLASNRIHDFKDDSMPTVKMFDDGASALKLYCETIHEKLRQLHGSGLNANEGDCLSEDEVEWTDDDQTGEEEPSMSIMTNGKQTTFPIPDLVPPPPPTLFGKVAQAGTNKEALTNMLMSWYMSGYHTGYYEGMQNAKTSTASSAKRSNH